MIQISLCMIVKNEEDTLDRCLNSVHSLVDEIIIVDTGSIDNTKEIAAKYTSNIYDMQWIDDFSAARNFSFSKATKDYVMWLDADDIILEEDRIKILALKDDLNGTQKQVVAKYNVGFDDEGNVTLSYFRERILLRSASFKWVGRIHEIIAIQSDAIYSDFAITHKKIHPTEKGRNLRIFETMIKEGNILDSRQMFYYARELYYNNQIEAAIAQFNRFLSDPNGWVENKINACKDLSNCYKLIGQKDNSLTTLLRSLEYDSPRAEICCDIGLHFMNIERYEIAIFWYNTAISKKPNLKSGGFILLDHYDYIPFIQLCVCYDRVGEHYKAYFYNEQAALVKPNSSAVDYNRNYFKNINISTYS